MKYLLLTLTFFQLFACVKEQKPKYELFVGTYTRKEGHVNGKGEGVYRLFLDSNFNETKTRQIIGGVINPSWVKLEKDLLFCAEETTPDGKITSFKIDGDKVNLGNSVSSKGGAPCHLDCSEGKLFVSNYVGNNAVSFNYDKNGQLSEAVSDIRFLGKGTVLSRQEASHPHQIVLNNKVPEVYVTDLGTDTIYTLEYDGNGILKRLKNQDKVVDAGDGPRHWVGGYNWYVLNELSSTISVLTKFGQQKIQKISTLPSDYQGKNSTAEILLNGNFVYATNRGHNSIVIFKIKDDGQLEQIGFESTRGDCPRNMAFSPDFKYLFCANQNSDNILIFKILEDGKLAFKKELSVKTPVCLAFKNN